MSMQSLMIRASAGSGKTFQLSNRFLALLAAGAEPSELIALTFTRKAAGEFADRILSRLAEGSLDEEAACRQLQEAGFVDAPATLQRINGLRHGGQVRAMQRLGRERLDAFIPRLFSGAAQAAGR